MEVHTSSAKPSRRRLGLSILLPLVLLVPLLAAGQAGAATTACTQPDGFEIRVDWTTTGASDEFVDITNLRMRTTPGGPLTNYVDTWGRVAKLEWWAPSSIHHLLTQTDSPWNQSGATFIKDQTSYDRWYGAADQRTAILATSPFIFTQPKVTNRDNGSGLARQADLCNVFLANWPIDNSGPRVAIAGDSITVQMTKQFLTRDFDPSLPGTNWRPFVEPQSGQSFSGMQGEIRGLAQGIRNPLNGVQTKPDSIVLALGTNDANTIAFKPTQAERDAALVNFNTRFASALDAVEEVECKVLVTVHESGWNYDDGQAVWDGLQKQAREDINDIYRQTAANRDDVVLVEWADLSAPHRWYQPTEAAWYTNSNYHPNGTGLEVLSNLIYDAATGGC